VWSLLALLCAVAVGLFWASVGWGAVTHKYLSSITEIPASSGAATPGALAVVSTMALDSGNLYVAEPGQGESVPERLDEFDAASGAFVRQFSLPSSLRAFNFFGLAAGHATGEEQVYAGAEDGEVKDFVVVFDGQGHTLGQPWSGSDTPSGAFTPYGIGGIAADSSTNLSDWAAGDVYVSDRNSKVVDVFKPLAGGKEEYVTQIEGPEAGEPFAEPSLVAVDQANGEVIVLDSNDVLDIFEPTVFGRYALVTRVTGTPNGPFKFISDFENKPLAVDGNGDIYLVEGEAPAVVDEFSAQGVYLGELTGTPTHNFYRLGGLAADPATNELYVGESANSELEEPGSVDIYGPNLIVPDVTTEPPSNITPTGATIAGTVNPDNAGEATCQFVWGTTTEFGNTSPCAAAIPNGNAPVPVQASLAGLSPDTTYHYRLQAANGNGLSPGEPYQDQEFHTPGPGIHEEWATNVASTSATFNAEVDPNGSPTTYYFQYGTSASYESAIPVAPGASIGSGSGDVSVVQHAQGLSAATTYHYRVVAVSQLSGGEVVEFTGPDQTLTTQPAASGSGLLDGRAWEMVSPPNKDGASLETAMTINGSAMQASLNGSAVSYVANTPIEDRPPANRAIEFSQIFSTRSAAGWTSKVVAMPYRQVGYSHLGYGSEYRLFSPDLSSALVTPFAEPEFLPEGTERTPYVRHNFACGAAPVACYVPLITTADVEPGAKWADRKEKWVEPVTATPDISHVIIHTELVKLLPGGAAEEGGEGSTYEWSDGKLQLVTILPDGEPAEAGGTVGSRGSMRYAISDDGSRVVFQAEDSGKLHLYTRDTATAQTLQVDAAEPGVATGEGQPFFQLASSDGSRVFFTDTARLTADSTSSPGFPQAPDLYEFDVNTGKLADLTIDSNRGEHASVQGLVQGASEDGSYVYFVADGALAPGASPRGRCEARAQDASCNLYVRHDGVTTLIAVLSATDQPWDAQLADVPSRVSPNGRWFAFMSDRSLTGYDNRDANSGALDEEVFLYDAATGRLHCMSCDPTGARPLGVFEPSKGESNALGPLVDRRGMWTERWLSGVIPAWNTVTLSSSLYQSRYLFDSGRLFFMSNDALVPQDVNGAMDVYEYEPEGEGGCNRADATFEEAYGGCVDLISSGGSAEESTFMDASENGDDAFFLTAAKLRPEDYDNTLDLYDARVCSASSPCLPPRAASPPPCVTGDSCKPAPSPQPTIFGASPSATFSGVGNLASASTPTVTHRSLTQAQKLRRALQACKRKRVRRRRMACIRQVRRRGRGRAAAKGSVSTMRGR